MNAQQRRKAYRAIKAMVGKAVTMTLADGKTVRRGVALGLTKPTIELASMSPDATFSVTRRPSVHRVRVRLESKATMSPLISRVAFI